MIKSCGDQNLITGIKARKTLKDVAEFSGSIDPKSFSQFVTPHPQNVHFLGMPTDVIAADGIDANALGKTLKAVKSIYPITIIDAGANLNTLALKALEFSTMILLVVPPDILAVNQSKRTLSELITMLFPKEMVFVIMNQGQKGHPISPEIMTKQVGRPVFSVIPKDDQSCIQALTRQTCYNFCKGSPFGKAITETTRKIIQKNVLRSLENLNKPSDVASKTSAQMGLFKKEPLG